MNHGSVFSGIGGFDLAAEWMGWENKFQCESDKFCQRILKYRWPKAKLYEDIRKTDFTVWRGKIDILTGGFPCQPFSQAGQRKGANDNRYLWPEMLRCINEVRPGWVIAENVAGITSMVFDKVQTGLEKQTTIEGEEIHLSMEAESVLLRISEDFENAGYTLQILIIPACAVNAPHRRDRVWFVANANSGTKGSSRTSRKVKRNRSNQLLQQKRRGRATKFNYGFGNVLRIIANSKDKRRKTRQGKILNSSGRRKLEKYKSLHRRSIRGGIKPTGASRLTTNANSIRSQRSTDKGINRKKGANSRAGQFKQLSQSIWEKFPTQSPVCGGNDGIPTELDGITLSNWKKESIKGFGNAIVPQVVLEKFKIIEQINKRLE